MSQRLRLTDDMIRSALRPLDDYQVDGLAASVSSAIARTSQRRWWLTRVRQIGWAIRPMSTTLRIAILLLLLLGLLLALYLPGALRPARNLDSPMFHGDAARTGVTDEIGPSRGAVTSWQISLPGALRNSPPALADGRLFAGDAQGFVGAYDVASGTKRWQTQMSRTASSPAVGGGLVIVGGSDGVYALGEDDGRIVWHVASATGVKSPPAIVGDVIYASYDGQLAAMTLEDAALLWRTPLGASGNHAPAVANGVVYIGTDDGSLHAVSTAHGEVLWQRTIGDGDLSTPAVADGVIYVATGVDHGAANHALCAVDVRDGAELWRYAADDNAEMYIGAVSEGVVFAVGLDGMVAALRDGIPLWTFDAGAPIGSVATLSDGILYVSASDGSVDAIDSATGQRRWSITVDGDPAPVIVGPHALYVGTDLGELTAFTESPAASGNASP